MIELSPGGRQALNFTIPATLGLAMIFGLVFSPMIANEVDCGFWVAYAVWWWWAIRLLPLLWFGALLMAMGFEAI